MQSEATGSDELVERVLPEATGWNGHGKYGPALCMDECTLHIMSRGFGAKDGDGYFTFDPNKFDWDRDDDGSEYMAVPLSNSDLLFLRDQLNKLFPLTTIEASRNETLRRENLQLRENVKLAARTFRRYEELHRQKGTQEGDLKAESNAELAATMEAALEASRNGEIERLSEDAALDALRCAYLAGATDVHIYWRAGGSDTEPDFAEAARDYASDHVTSLQPSTATVTGKGR